MDHANIAFRVGLAPLETRTFLVRIASRDTAIVDPAIWTEAAFWSAVQRQRLLDGVYYGVLFGLALYNLFLALATRERAYLAYVGFQVAMGLTNGAVDKYTFKYLWPTHPIWATRSEQVFGMIAVAAAMHCARLLLDTKRYSKRVDVSLAAVGALSLLVAVGAAFHDAPPLELNGMTALAFAGIAMLVVGAVVVSRAGNPHGRIFLAAWSLLLVGVVSSSLFATGFIESLVGYDLLKVGSAAEALLLSFGLAARIRALEAEREQAQAALLVERTRRVDALSLLVAGVAHEIGNPLNFAQGGADALGEALASRTDNGERKARRALALVDGGLARIRRLVDDLRIDLGERSAFATEVDVRSEVDDALELLGPRLEERGVAVTHDRPAVPLLVRARAGDLAQVFGNLARNAADAMPGGGELHVAISAEPGGADVRVVFRDQGDGVPEEIRDRIFEPFFTRRTPERSEGSEGSDAGTGLGLFISAEIARRCGGSLTLEPSSGGGATFVVRLPRARGGPPS